MYIHTFYIIYDLEILNHAKFHVSISRTSLKYKSALIISHFIQNGFLRFLRPAYNTVFLPSPSCIWVSTKVLAPSDILPWTVTGHLSKYINKGPVIVRLSVWLSAKGWPRQWFTITTLAPFKPSTLSGSLSTVERAWSRFVLQFLPVAENDRCHFSSLVFITWGLKDPRCAILQCNCWL